MLVLDTLKWVVSNLIGEDIPAIAWKVQNDQIKQTEKTFFKEQGVSFTE